VRPPRPQWRAGATRARLVVIALAAAAVVAAFVDRSPSSDADRAPLRIELVYSPDLDELLSPLIERFNDRGIEVAGRTVSVRNRARTSGEAERMIAAGDLKPVVWLPASSLWGRLLNAHVRRAWVPLDNPSIVHSPQVIAVPERVATRLGWPGREIGWRDIPALVASGAVRFGHPSPLTSTSGLSALAAEYYAVTGKLAGLTLEDVNRARAEVRKIEESVVHYAPTADDFLDQLARYGPSYAAAVVVQETSLVQFNEENSWRLVAVYPADGTFMADYPYIVLQAPWVAGAEREAAHAFLQWLRTEVTPETAARSGYRVAAPGEPVLPPVDPEHGADPSEPDVLLRSPSPDVLTAILGSWRVDRKLADAVLTIDISASMSARGRIEEVRLAVERFLEPLSRRHRAGLVLFSDDVETAVQLAPVGAGGQSIRERIADVEPTGERALYDGIAEAVRQASAGSDAGRTKAVVVVTDGRDNASSLDLDRLLRTIRGSRVRVFTVAYGEAADRESLERIAQASQGKSFTASAGELADAFRSIALFF
jgi:Ca-activated chloride channel homolog